MCTIVRVTEASNGSIIRVFNSVYYLHVSLHWNLGLLLRTCTLHQICFRV